MWDERYATQGFVFGVEPNRFVEEHLGGLSPRRVLDLGSGQGRNAVWLAAQGHRVTAVDLSPVATEQAKQLAVQAGVTAEFVSADLSTWEPEVGGYDVVVLSYLQLVPHLRTLVHRKAVTALAPEGMVFLIAHHLDNLEHGIGGPQSPEFLFTEDELRSDFAGLVVDQLERVMRPVDRDGATGDAIDLLLVAHRL